MEHDDAKYVPVEWDAGTWELINWFRRDRDRLTRKQFVLSPGVAVADTNRFLKALERDIQAGPNGPRARRSALQDDLRRLRELFGEPASGADVQRKLPVGLEAAAL